MKRWEYLEVKEPKRLQIDELNKFGEVGYELVTFQVSFFIIGINYYTYIFKREVMRVKKTKGKK